MLVFGEALDSNLPSLYQGKNSQDRVENQQTQSTSDGYRTQAILHGGRRVLSPLHQPCSLETRQNAFLVCEILLARVSNQNV